MKNKFSYLMGVTLLFAFGCAQGEKKEQIEQKAENVIPADTVKQCYTAVFEGDTAFLNLKIVDSLEVTGDLVINYAEKAGNVGIVRGKFHGDTLLVDYSFKTGENPIEFSNPLAFLKSEQRLKMGVGQIETAYGRSYFVKDKPIDYEQGKFNFIAEPCK